jgi:hypothetical protein
MANLDLWARGGHSPCPGGAKPIVDVGPSLSFNLVERSDVDHPGTGQVDYRPNRFEIPPQRRAEIGQRCSEFVEKHGYSTSAAEARPP